MHCVPNIWDLFSVGNDKDKTLEFLNPSKAKKQVEIP